ncbi:MAG: PhoH family protein [Candidatus Kapabacteria bacterium]|nr:PhoH family protein [Ignavibacteriota bacterium]MCW5883695.1 PhoH family protein [Candidatus Kapabacteria bacterium]
MELLEKKIAFDNVELLTLFGSNDTHLNLIENRFKAGIIVRGNIITLKGPQEDILKIEKIFEEMLYMIKRNKNISEDDVKTVIELIDGNHSKLDPKKDNKSINQIIFQGVKDSIRIRNPKQLDYLNKVEENDLVFAIGPAGTGKTFLAVAMALAALRNNEVSRIILSRPAVEAGESLGFLPGDLQEKIDPYLRPLTDAMHYMISPEKVKTLMERNIIEITPLAYMRGRTLSNSFIILDEAQNATTMQMKMFLTRLGVNSKAIITGDITQIDLPLKKLSGLIDANRILQNIKGIEFVYFDNKDVVRHRLVADIVKAYEKDDSSTKEVTKQKIKDNNKQ